MKAYTKIFRKFTSNSNLIITSIVSIIILVVLILLPIVFLNNNGKIGFDNGKENYINENDIKKGTSKSFPVGGKVKLYRKAKDEVVELDLEDYVMGVVASEVPANFEVEALKAQAVAARTYYMNRRTNPCDIARQKGAELCDTTNCQVYMDKEERMKAWSKKSAEENWKKIEDAVKSTSGQILTYDGEVLEYPLFFSTSSGKTEDAKDVFAIDVPYLKSIESSGEEIAPKYETEINISNSKFIKNITNKYPQIKLENRNLKDSINIKNYTDAGSVKEIEIAGVTISGKDFRSTLGLNSSNFKLKFNSDSVSVQCKGYGHGVGMSQWGANVMAKNGEKYDKILEHYYTDVKLDKINYTE